MLWGMDKHDRVGLYLRISQDSEQKGEGVARQRDDCLKIIEANGWTLVDTYRDNDKSADRKAEEREGFARLLGDVRSGKVTRIMAWARDRLSRSTRDAADLEDLAYEYGVLITIHPETTYDLTEPAEMLNFQVQGAVGGFETGQKKKRQRAANSQRAQQGKPYGRKYTFGWSDRAMTTHHPVEAPALVKAYNDCIAGVSIAEIANEWNARPDLNPRKARTWTHTTVRTILKNPVNAGTVIFKGVEMLGVAAQWEPIVSRDTFDAALAVIASRRPAGAYGKRRPHKYLLSGILKCSNCGNGMSGTVREKGVEYYRCWDTASHCSMTIKADIANNIVEAFAYSALNSLTPDEVYSAEQQSQRIEYAAEIERVDRELDELSHSGLSMSRKLQWATELEQERTQWAKKADALVTSSAFTEVVGRVLPWMQDGHVDLERGADSMGEVMKGWRGLSLSQKQLILRHVGSYSCRRLKDCEFVLINGREVRTSRVLIEPHNMKRFNTEVGVLWKADPLQDI